MMSPYIKYQWKSQHPSRRHHHLRTISRLKLELPLSACYLIDRLSLGALGPTSRYSNMDDMMRKKSITLTMLQDIYHHFRDCLIHLSVMRSPLFHQLDLCNLHAELSLKHRRSKKKKKRKRKKQDRTMKWFPLIYS